MRRDSSPRAQAHQLMSVCAVNPCPGCEQVPVRLRPPLVVDQRLVGMTTVQTLSRVNRTHGTEGGEQKRKTFVFDLVNAPEDIRQSFEPYFTGACLETETDLYVVVHLATKPAHAGVFIENEVRTTAELWLSRKGNNRCRRRLRSTRRSSSPGTGS